ncbi:pyridoxal-phosphate dependent enzyme, partial [Salmonella enterica]|uniref:pyridoxal-phosphate dependent enzyme n=1 Tax=Salmonella enterica TaxID=28901 RepID=UPI003CE9BC64
TLYEAAERARQTAADEQLVFVHPYDDPKVMAGQGTIALEILEDLPDLEQIVVPIGGGGLISGIAVAAKAIKPEIEIIGVEAALYPSFQ